MYTVLWQTILNSESLILGDLTLPHIDLISLSGTEGESHRVLEFLEDNYPSQLVTEPRLYNTQEVIIVTKDNLVCNIAVSKHLSSFDHKMVLMYIYSRHPGDLF